MEIFKEDELNYQGNVKTIILRQNYLKYTYLEIYLFFVEKSYLFHVNSYDIKIK